MSKIEPLGVVQLGPGALVQDLHRNPIRSIDLCHGLHQTWLIRKGPRQVMQWMETTRIKERCSIKQKYTKNINKHQKRIKRSSVISENIQKIIKLYQTSNKLVILDQTATIWHSNINAGELRGNGSEHGLQELKSNGFSNVELNKKPLVNLKSSFVLWILKSTIQS